MKKTLTLTIEAADGRAIHSHTIVAIVADLDIYAGSTREGSGSRGGVSYTYRWADAVEPAFPACGPGYRVTQ